MNEQNNVILVDKNDTQIGVEEKLKAHKEGKLHRAFSIFIFNKDGKLLLQQRAREKYHSGGLWTNTVCSHPKPGRNLEEEAKQRLIDEMGFTTDLKEIFSFVYKSQYENGLCEHEFDHIFIGYFNDIPIPNPAEAMDYKWINVPDLLNDVKKSPQNYTSWFQLLLSEKDFIKQIL